MKPLPLFWVFNHFCVYVFGTYGKIQQFHHHHKCAKEKVMTTLSSGCQIASELQFVCHKGVILIAKYIYSRDTKGRVAQGIPNSKSAIKVKFSLAY